MHCIVARSTSSDHLRAVDQIPPSLAWHRVGFSQKCNVIAGTACEDEGERGKKDFYSSPFRPREYAEEEEGEKIAQTSLEIRITME